MRTISFWFYISGEYDKGIISPLIGWIGWIANKKKLLKLQAVRDYMAEHKLKRLLISHEEICFEDRYWNCPEFMGGRTTLIPCCDNAEKGVCFSSASRGGKLGVRFAPASEILKHRDRWLSIKAELPDEVEQEMFDESKSREGDGYDLIGVFFKLFSKSGFIQSKIKWWCSEICNWVAYKAYWKWLKLLWQKYGLNALPNGNPEFYKWRQCFSKHRRWSPVANLILMLQAGYEIRERETINLKTEKGETKMKDKIGTVCMLAIFLGLTLMVWGIIGLANNANLIENLEQQIDTVDKSIDPRIERALRDKISGAVETIEAVDGNFYDYVIEAKGIEINQRNESEGSYENRNRSVSIQSITLSPTTVEFNDVELIKHINNRIDSTLRDNKRRNAK